MIIFTVKRSFRELSHISPSNLSELPPSPNYPLPYLTYLHNYPRTHIPTPPLPPPTTPPPFYPKIDFFRFHISEIGRFIARLLAVLCSCFLCKIFASLFLRVTFYAFGFLRFPISKVLSHSQFQFNWRHFNTKSNDKCAETDAVFSF